MSKTLSVDLRERVLAVDASGAPRLLPAWRTAQGRRAARVLEDDRLRPSLRFAGIATSFVLNGPINRIAFEAYVEKVRSLPIPRLSQERRFARLSRSSKSFSRSEPRSS